MDKAKLKAAFTQIEKQHGPGTVFRLGSGRKLEVKVLTTGVISIDIASGVGGIGRGRVTEIFGPESGGKTTLTLQIIAEAQKLGGLAAFIDAEHALDPVYAKALGVDIDNLVVSQPDNGEQALEVCDTLVRSEQFDIIVVDSVSALVPRKELEGEMGDPQMGLLARLMSQAMRKLTGTVSKTHTALVFINQVRDKIGVMYGNPETTTGGRALKFAASMRIRVAPSTAIKEGDKQIGNIARIKFVKNKVAAPFKEAEVNAIYGRGFDPVNDLLTHAVKNGVVEKAGAWYSFHGDRLGQGESATVEGLRSNDLLRNAIDTATRAIVFAKPEEPAQETEE